MNVKDLLQGIKYDVIQNSDRVIDIKDIKHNSLEIGQDDCFIALHGKNYNGDGFLQESADKGACLLIIDDDISCNINSATMIIKVEDTRQIYPLIARNFHNKTVDKLQIIGVVGTNGKSSVAYLTWKLLNDSGIKAGLIGTICTMIGDIRAESSMTTPDPMELHLLLHKMYVVGVKVVVMEVSAHAIALHKINGINFDIGIFTNFSQDHLDFFGDMESYKKVKQDFFINNKCNIAVINNDDACGREIAGKIKIPYITYGIENDSDCVAKKIIKCADCTKFQLDLYDDKENITTNLIGKFNIYNIMASIITCRLFHVKLSHLARRLTKIKYIEGRANSIVVEGVNYVIDFAHTPDGLKNILTELKEITDRKLIVVFGCGGNRDKTKRPLMGKIASELADTVIVTSDNPRYENKSSIIDDICAGIDSKINLITALNREDAIQYASGIALPGDTILIAGKGSEEYIEENGKKYYYSDKSVLEKLLGVVW